MLPCPTCGANIDARNDELGIAACGQCGGLFEWPALQLSVPPIDPPRRVRVVRRDGKVRAIRWRSEPSPVFVGVTVVMLLFAYPLSAASTFWASLWAAFVVWVLLSHIIGRVVGIRIELGPVISIRKGIARRRRFAATSIGQPFVRRTHGSYDLCATQADGTVVDLAKGFVLGAEARYVEHELEAALEIVDAPVAGDARSAPTLADSAAPLRSLRLVCPACATAVTASDLQLGKGQAICAGCRKGMLLGGPVLTGTRTVLILPPPRAVVDRASGAFVWEAGRATGGRVAMGSLALALVAGVPVVKTLLFGPEDEAQRWTALVLGVLWAWAGAFTAAGFWNRTRLRVEDAVLHVSVGPIPPRTRRSMPVAEIVQVFVREQPRTFLTFPLRSDSYELCAVDRSGAVLPLVGGMFDLREARHLEEQLEQYLGILDAPVPGEVEGKMLRHVAGTPSLPGSGNLSLPDASPGGELTVPRATGALSESD